MPWRARLAGLPPFDRNLRPGTVRHVILRGLARGQIVADAQDREACVARVGDRAAATAELLVAALRAIRPESRFEFIQV